MTIIEFLRSRSDNSQGEKHHVWATADTAEAIIKMTGKLPNHQGNTGNAHFEFDVKEFERSEALLIITQRSCDYLFTAESVMLVCPYD